MKLLSKYATITNMEPKQISINKSDLRFIKSLSNRQKLFFERLFLIPDFHQMIDAVRDDLGDFKPQTIKDDRWFTIGLMQTKNLLPTEFNLPRGAQDTVNDFLESYKYYLLGNHKGWSAKQLKEWVSEYILTNKVSKESDFLFEEVRHINAEDPEEIDMNYYQIIFPKDTRKQELKDFVDKQFKSVIGQKQKTKLSSDSTIPLFERILIWNEYVRLKSEHKRVSGGIYKAIQANLLEYSINYDERKIKDILRALNRIQKSKLSRLGRDEDRFFV